MTLDNYFKQISKYPLLTHEDEIKLAEQSRSGDDISRELLINSNLRLVVYIAKKYSRSGNLDDLIQEGNIGLIKASERYKPELGFRFSSYASFWIRQSIFQYLTDQRIIKLPQQKIQAINKIRKITEQYLMENGQEPTNEYLAQRLNESGEEYTEKDVEFFLSIYEKSSVHSLNLTIGDEGNSELIDFIPGEDGREKVENISSDSVFDEVEIVIDKLNLNEKDTYILRTVLLGMDDFLSLSKRLNMSPSRVKGSYNKGIRTLRKALTDSPRFKSLTSVLSR